MGQAQILLLGTSYQIENVEERECLRFDPAEQTVFLNKLIASPAISEASLLSTCNRTECYLIASAPAEARQHVGRALRFFRGLAAERALFAGYQCQNEHAVRHLFRVAAGLESQLLGENQILAQIKEAYEQAISAQAAGPILHRAFHLALQAGKRVRHETRIAQGVVSSGSAAADLLLHTLDARLEKPHVLIVGAGKMAEMAVQEFKKRGQDRVKISVTSRKLCHAYRLAQSRHVSFFPIQELPLMLQRGHGLIAALSADEYVLTPQHFLHAQNTARLQPFVCVDIGVPRNIDPDIRKLEGVVLRDIDDLGSVVTQTLEERRREIPAAERIIEETLAEFTAWRRARHMAPLIEGLQRYIETVCRSELAHYGRAFNFGDEEKLARFSRSLAKKIMHAPIHQLRALAQDGDANSLEVLNRFFGFVHEYDAKNPAPGHAPQQAGALAGELGGRRAAPALS